MSNKNIVDVPQVLKDEIWDYCRVNDITNIDIFTINLIKQGGDYGWPFVTYGQPYGGGDYVRPTKTGTHTGFIEPLTYWVPSIAPTELVQLPKDGWGQWSNQLLLGTLKEQAVVFIKLDQKLGVIEQQKVDVGHRIRDLEVLPSGLAVATTDSGELLLISLAS